MEFYVPSTLVAFLLGAACASAVWLAVLAALVYLAYRAKARREHRDEEE